MPPLPATVVEEQPVQVAAQAPPAFSGIDAHEVDVALVKTGLGHKADQKGDELAVLTLKQVTTVAEMLEQQPR
jgi:hypothetical protein